MTVSIIIIIFIIIIYVYELSTCADHAEERIRFCQGLSLNLYLYFRIFYFCIFELRVLVNLKYRKIVNATNYFAFL